MGGSIRKGREEMLSGRIKDVVVSTREEDEMGK